MEVKNKYNMCCDCKYMSTSYGDEPCKSCSCSGEGKTKWEPNRNKFKPGDILVIKNDTGTTNLYIYLRNNWVLRVPNYVTVSSSYILSIPYRLQNYMIDKIIADDVATWKDIDLFEYARPEVIAAHDNKAKNWYDYKSFSDWFSELINKEPEKKTEPKVFTTPNMIKDVIFRDPATIIFWEDGTKTVVKTQDGEEYDKEKGFAMAVCKKVFGNERDYYNVFKRWMRKGKEVHNEQG